MILDKLMEKKDLMAYLIARKTILTEEKNKAANIKNVQQREVAIRQVHGRLLEVGYMIRIMSADQLKTQSKVFWKKAAVRTVNHGAEDAEL